MSELVELQLELLICLLTIVLATVFPPGGRGEGLHTGRDSWESSWRLLPICMIGFLVSVEFLLNWTFVQHFVLHFSLHDNYSLL